MAKTGLSNPEYYAGPPLGAKVKERAVDGHTWKSGQPCWQDSGLWKPMVTDGKYFMGLFADSQGSLTSSTDVYVQRIESSTTQLKAQVCYDDSDAFMDRSSQNVRYGIHVGANSATVNKNETTATCVTVKFPLWVKEGYKNLAADDPAWCVFTVNDSSLGN